MKIKTLVLIGGLLFLLGGCQSVPMKSNSTTIQAIDPTFAIAYQQWDIAEANSRLESLKQSQSISNDEMEKLQLLLTQRVQLKAAWLPFVESLKQHLQANDYRYVLAHSDTSTIPVAVIRKLRGYNLSQATFIWGNPQFEDSYATFVLVVNYGDQSAYFKIMLIAENNQWWIYSVDEMTE